MSTDPDVVLREALELSQRMETLAGQVAALAIASRQEVNDLRADQARLRERLKRLETLIDASMLFSLRDRQADRNEQRSTERPESD